MKKKCSKKGMDVVIDLIKPLMPKRKSIKKKKDKKPH